MLCQFRQGLSQIKVFHQVLVYDLNSLDLRGLTDEFRAYTIMNTAVQVL